ncbi:MAG: cation diffusion facilitator family transporter [Bdellovibrionales bacterium]|nr:cation diffusion facilitator family transporter [Bdellovibrionales bacterium]
MGIKDQFLSHQELQQRNYAAGISLFVSVILMLIKFWAHNLTDSQAIFSDAMESIVNVLAAFITLGVIWYAAKPKDEDHPYGHGKIEFFSSAFEGGMISFASIMIIFEAIQAFWRGERVHHLDQGLILVALAALVNYVLGKYLKYKGKVLSSVALVASGEHIIADFWTSAGVIVGLLLTYLTQWFWLDMFLACAVGLWLGRTGFLLVVKSIGGLMDQEDPQTLQTLVQIFASCLEPGIIQIHHVRVIRSGWYHHIDAHVVMPEFWNVKQIHNVVDSFENSVIQKYEYGGEMNFHVDPCRKAYCRVCSLGNCPIRVEKFVEQIPVQLEDLRSPLEPAQFHPPTS